jgi:hypothetical protein
MRISLVEAGKGTILAGAMNGRNTLGRLMEATMTEPGEPAPVFLDFSGVEVATASFLRESVLAFRDIVRRRHSSFYPVIANANEVVRDEFIELFRPRGDVFMACVLDNKSVVQSELLGELDPKQRVTFKLVCEHGEIDAGQLMRTYGESEGLRHTTAWNNRLASLAALGLVVELSEGRAKRYRPLLEGA